MCKLSESKKATYEATIKFKVVHEIDTVENLKDYNEFAQDIGEMVCDEATMVGAVASYDIIEMKLNVK